MKLMSKNPGLEMYQISRDTYNSKSIDGDVTLTFSGLRYLIRQYNQTITAKHNEMQEMIADITRTYQSEIASGKIEELKSSYRDIEFTAQQKLLDRLNKIDERATNEIERFCSVPPTADGVRYIQSLNMRGSSISDAEWKIAVKKVTNGGNYQEMCQLETVGDAIGKEYSVPYKLEDLQELLADAINAYRNIINNKLTVPTDDWDVTTISLMKEGSLHTDRINVLDTALGVAVENPANTLNERTKSAAAVALHAGNYDLFNRVYAFRAEHRDEIMTPLEAKTEVISQAEALIAECLDAGKEA